MRSRSQLLHLALLIVALLGPILFLAGVLARGVTFLHVAYPKLGFIYGAMALSAASAAYLTFRRGPLIVRLVVGVALLANLGSVVYTGNLWLRQMQIALTELEMVPFDPVQVGILVAPANNGSAETAESRVIEKKVNEIVVRNGLEPYIAVRHVYPISSERQARRVGERMRANVVVWKTEQGREHRLTVLGANETEIALEPLTLMLLMSAQEPFIIRDTRAFGEDAASPLAAQVVAPVATGFAFLATGRPMLAAAQFQSVVDVPNLVPATLASLHNHFATALLLLDRPDLAHQEYTLSNTIAPNPEAWVGLGNVAIARREWDVATEAFVQALILDAYGSMPYCGLGITFARQSNLSRTLSSYRQAVALEPTQAAPYALLGLAYELTADIEHAREAYKLCVQHAGPNAGLNLAASERAKDVVRHPPTAVPTATPLPTPTAVPVPESQLYVVKRGDTLGAIANELGVTVDALIALNEIDNPKTLQIGQKLLIPESP